MRGWAAECGEGRESKGERGKEVEGRGLGLVVSDERLGSCVFVFAGGEAVGW